MERYNATGQQGRNCPICGRVGTLTGDRVDGGTLECTGGMAPGRSGDLARGGCCARFVYRPKDPSGPTLERLPTEPWNRGARLADDVFCACGARGYAQCPTCSRMESREAGR